MGWHLMCSEGESVNTDDQSCGRVADNRIGLGPPHFLLTLCVVTVVAEVW